MHLQDVSILRDSPCFSYFPAFLASCNFVNESKVTLIICTSPQQEQYVTNVDLNKRQKNVLFL